MIRRLLPLLAIALLIGATGLFGCSTRVSQPPPPYLSDLSKPSYVLSNFILAYQARDIPRYRAILTDDFRYRFQEGSKEAERFPDGWDVTQDSIATHAFLGDGRIEAFQVVMLFAPADSSEYEGDTTFVAPTSHYLFIVGRSDTTFRMEDDPPQEFHLILGREDMGENPEWFYIRAWTELPSLVVETGAGAKASSGPEVETVTWGALKASYAPVDEEL